eukprot:c8617_g1_i1.p1 GENE.c8617_g1_i1~~c8617_g1_i1.p1  ORF type:complete len:317 (-),score=86.29 c8617_g1_i1:100-909(-)
MKTTVMLFVLACVVVAAAFPAVDSEDEPEIATSNNDSEDTTNDVVSESAKTAILLKQLHGQHKSTSDSTAGAPISDSAASSATSIIECENFMSGNNKIYTYTAIGQVVIADSDKAAIYCNVSALSGALTRRDAFLPGTSIPTTWMSNEYDCMWRAYTCKLQSDLSTTVTFFGHTGGISIAKPYIACTTVGDCKLLLSFGTVDLGQFFILTTGQASNAVTMKGRSSSLFMYAGKGTGNTINLQGTATAQNPNFRVCPYNVPFDQFAWDAC